MPTYDVKCLACSFEGVIVLKMVEVTAWDRDAQCPKCDKKQPDFRRIIKFAPSNYGGEKATARSKTSEQKTRQKEFVSSGKKDDMRHNQAKNRNHNQIEEAIEIVKSGVLEGL